VISRVDGRDKNSSAEAGKRGANDDSRDLMSGFDRGSRGNSSVDLAAKGAGGKRESSLMTASKVAVDAV
jgi:hypothetical protein